MSDGSRRGGSMIPALRYSDPSRAIEWLGAAFGFAPHLVVRNDDGSIAHAELTLGDAMIMLGSGDGQGDGEYGEWVRPPSRPDDVVQLGLYVVTPDLEAHYSKAVAHGAEVLLPLAVQSYGGSEYTCRDLQGFVWTFGSYDPWVATPSA